MRSLSRPTIGAHEELNLCSVTPGGCEPGATIIPLCLAMLLSQRLLLLVFYFQFVVEVNCKPSKFMDSRSSMAVQLRIVILLDETIPLQAQKLLGVGDVIRTGIGEIALRFAAPKMKR